MRLSYRVSDNSGRTRETVTVYNNGRVVSHTTTVLQASVAGQKYAVTWTPGSAGQFKFCVAAADAAGNSAHENCAPAVVRTSWACGQPAPGTELSAYDARCNPRPVVALAPTFGTGVVAGASLQLAFQVECCTMRSNCDNGQFGNQRLPLFRERVRVYRRGILAFQKLTNWHRLDGLTRSVSYKTTPTFFGAYSWCVLPISKNGLPGKEKCARFTTVHAGPPPPPPPPVNNAPCSFAGLTIYHRVATSCTLARRVLGMWLDGACGLCGIGDVDLGGVHGWDCEGRSQGDCYDTGSDSEFAWHP